MINRREFLQHATAGAAVLAAGTGATDKLLASPYGMPVGITLYNVREGMATDARGTIKKLADIGYKEVEIFHFRRIEGKTAGPVAATASASEIFGMPGKEFARLLSDNGMRAPSGQYVLGDIKTNWEGCIEQARAMGLEYMANAGFINKEETPDSLDDWKRLVDIFNQAAQPVQNAGMTYNIHNHHFEFRKFGDTLVFDYLTKNLDPKIKFTLDCYWAIRSGQDPVALIKTHPGRVPILHIKDIPKGLGGPIYPAKMGMYAEIGTGTVDWKKIFAAAPAGGMKHFYYEQDFCERPPLESAKTSFEYLNKLTV